MSDLAEVIATTPTSPSIAAIDLDAVIADFTPKQEIFDVVLPDGTVLKFRAFRTRKEKKDWEAQAIKWFQDVVQNPKNERGSLKSQVKALGEFVPADTDEAMNAHLIFSVSHEPKFTIKQACRLLHAPALLEHIIGQIDAANESMYFRAQKTLIELAKKNSNETTSGEGNSE